MEPEVPVESPLFRTIVYRDVEIQYPSGNNTFCLEPEDTLTQREDGTIHIAIAATGKEYTFFPAHMDWVSIAERAHTRKLKPQQVIAEREATQSK